MTNKELKQLMNNLLLELNKSDNKQNDKLIIAKAVQLGMQYQEEKIKDGIDIVFKTLHNKNIK